jgi:hypothetical protein
MRPLKNKNKNPLSLAGGPFKVLSRGRENHQKVFFPFEMIT